MCEWSKKEGKVKMQKVHFNHDKRNAMRNNESAIIICDSSCWCCSFFVFSWFLLRQIIKNKDYDKFHLRVIARLNVCNVGSSECWDFMHPPIQTAKIPECSSNLWLRQCFNYPSFFNFFFFLFFFFFFFYFFLFHSLCWIVMKVWRSRLLLPCFHFLTESGWPLFKTISVSAASATAAAAVAVRCYLIPLLLAFLCCATSANVHHKNNN